MFHYGTSYKRSECNSQNVEKEAYISRFIKRKMLLAQHYHMKCYKSQIKMINANLKTNILSGNYKFLKATQAMLKFFLDDSAKTAGVHYQELKHRS